MYKPIKLLSLLITLLTLVACEPEKSEEKSVGSFRFQSTNYPIKSLRIEQIGIDDGEYTLRMTCYPITYKINEVSSSGYGSVINAYFKTTDRDFTDMSSYQISNIVNDSVASQLILYPKDSGTDTTYVDIEKGTMYVDSTETYLKYTFEFISTDGDSINGSYVGEHIYNYTVDQPAYGSLTFDTLSYQLSQPTLWQWDTIHSSSVYYYELIFYSTDTRFSDAGKVKDGIQFVLGFNSPNKQLKKGTYPTTINTAEAPALLYGFKINKVSWGSFWQIYTNSSAKSKANVTKGEVIINDIQPDYINLSFQLIDQLDYNVVGEYEGPIFKGTFKKKQQ